MEYHKLWPDKSYFCLWFLHLEVLKLVCLMIIELLFPVVLCFWRCLWQDLMAKKPFNKDFSFFSFLQNPLIWIATWQQNNNNNNTFIRLVLNYIHEREKIYINIYLYLIRPGTEIILRFSSQFFRKCSYSWMWWFSDYLLCFDDRL